MTFIDWGMLVVAVLSLVVAAIATFLARSAAKSAADQVELQKQLAIEDAQPYVWADIRQNPIEGSVLMLVVGNSGRTLARNVRLSIDKPLPTVGLTAETLLRDAVERFANGHASIAPGREWSWGLGVSSKILLEEERNLAFEFRVNADGPFGPIPELVYVVDMNDWRGTIAQGSGSLKQLNKSLGEVNKSLNDIRRVLAE